MQRQQTTCKSTFSSNRLIGSPVASLPMTCIKNQKACRQAKTFPSPLALLLSSMCRDDTSGRSSGAFWAILRRAVGLSIRRPLSGSCRSYRLRRPPSSTAYPPIRAKWLWTRVQQCRRRLGDSIREYFFRASSAGSSLAISSSNL